MILDSTIFDSEAKKMVSEQVVVARNERIEAVGKANKIKIPSGGRVINARGKYLIPVKTTQHAGPG